MVCLRNISVDTLHIGDPEYDDDDDDDDYDDNNNNNNSNNIFNCKWAVPRWQWLLCMYINMK